MNRRALALAVLVAAAGMYRLQLAAAEATAWSDLNGVPLILDMWNGRRAPGLDASVLAMLEPDTYINRLYNRGPTTASVYVGYHRSQSYGHAIHSPMNCLPGAGWQPVRTERIQFDDRGTAKRVVIEKGDRRQLVLYWYQSSTRIEGDEYQSKFHMVVDAFRTRRNDAALIRIVIPLRQGADDANSATREALTLARLIEPHVRRLLFEAT